MSRFFEYHKCEIEKSSAFTCFFHTDFQFFFGWFITDIHSTLCNPLISTIGILIKVVAIAIIGRNSPESTIPFDIVRNGRPLSSILGQNVVYRKTHSIIIIIIIFSNNRDIAQFDNQRTFVSHNTITFGIIIAFTRLIYFNIIVVCEPLSLIFVFVNFRILSLTKVEVKVDNVITSGVFDRDLGSVG